MPALIALCFALLLFGFVLLSPLDYLALGKEVAASLTFTSNIVYWTQSGYFDDESIEKWLLHTWSLSVEWQFYLLYPIVLVILHKLFNPKLLKPLLLGITLAALALSILVTYQSSSAAYFLLPNRAWQMLAGGLVFLYPLALSAKAKNAFALVGLTFIGIAFFVFSDRTPWPGYASLLPIIGTCCVLAANKSNSIWYSNPVTQSLGRWSYSIYLCHWPIVVVGYYFAGGENWWLIGIPASIIAGALSFTLVESKTLQDYRLSKLKYILMPLPTAFIIASLGFFVFLNNGLINRLPESKRPLAISAVQAEHDWVYPAANIQIEGMNIRKISGRSDKNILVLGASHAAQIYPYVAQLQSPYNVYFLTMGGCLVTPSMSNPTNTCGDMQNYQKLLDAIHFDKIVTTFYTFDNYLAPGETAKAQDIATRIVEYDAFLANIKRQVNSVHLILGEPKSMEFYPKLALRCGQ